MAEVTQTDANKGGLSQIGEDTADDPAIRMFSFGGIKLGIGSNTPDGKVIAPAGSMFVDIANTDLYMNDSTVGTPSTSWEKVGGQT